MNLTSEVGSYKRVTTTATLVLVSGPCVLYGVGVASVLTGQIVTLWDSSDITEAVGTHVLSTCTLAANTFTRVPAMLTNGLMFRVSNEDVDLTIYYSPAGGNT